MDEAHEGTLDEAPEGTLDEALEGTMDEALEGSMDEAREGTMDDEEAALMAAMGLPTQFYMGNDNNEHKVHTLCTKQNKEHFYPPPPFKEGQAYCFAHVGWLVCWSVYQNVGIP